MRTVVKSGEVYHLWAHQSQGYARCGNTSFQGRDAYSYRTIVARLVPDRHNPGAFVALITTRQYSNTTSKHLSAISQAVSHLTNFNVDEVLATPAVNLKKMIVDCKALEREARKANKRNAPTKWCDLWTRMHLAEKFAEQFNLKARYTWPADISNAEMQDAQSQIEVARYSKRAAKQAAEREDCVKRALDALPAWLAGEALWQSYRNFSVLPFAYLRIDPSDAGMVETSHNARVPLEHVKRALILVKAVWARGEAWQTNGHTIHLGHYQIDRIDADGTIHAGCHVFEKSEVERFAASLPADPQ